MTNLAVIERDGVLVVDSRLIAQDLGIEHRALLQTLDKHLKHIQTAFGRVAFEMEPLQTSGGKQLIRVAYLNEDQATLLMTFSRNNERVIQCKIDLVKAFSETKRRLANTPTSADPIATAFGIADHFRSLLAHAGIDPAIATLIGLKYIERQLPQLKPEVEESRELIGKHHASEGHYLTPTELGQQTGKKAKEINLALELAGFQVKTIDGKHSRWDLTETGKRYGKVFLAAAQTSRWSGGQVKWQSDVLQVLQLEASHV